MTIPPKKSVARKPEEEGKGSIVSMSPFSSLACHELMENTIYNRDSRSSVNESTCARADPHDSIEAYLLFNIFPQVIQKLLAVQVHLRR